MRERLAARSGEVHSAFALSRVHAEIEADIAARASEQDERDNVQRQQVELTGTLIDVVSMMHADAAANTQRSELRFKRSHDMQLAILGLTVLTAAVAVAGLIIAAP